jgi:hypothetical protein
VGGKVNLILILPGLVGWVFKAGKQELRTTSHFLESTGRVHSNECKWRGANCLLCK